MSETIFFESANADEHEAIRALLASCDLPVDDVEIHLGDFIVARSGGDVVGCIGLEKSRTFGLLRSLAVQPGFRSYGIAQELCRRLEARANDAGLAELYLLTTTAAEFFAKIAYRRVDRNEAPEWIRANRQFTTLCPSSAVLMRKDL